MYSDADGVQNWPDCIARKLMETEQSFGAQMQHTDVENRIGCFFTISVHNLEL